MENSNEVLPPSQSQQQPQQPKKWYNHKGIIVICILAVVAAVSVWIYFIYNQPQNLGPVVVQYKPKNMALSLSAIPASVSQQALVLQPLNRLLQSPQ